jgi:pimeloyl-ACP methyl ester carboxylesterase
MPLNSGAISYTKGGTGPVVLLIHGLGGTRRTWQHLIPGLARTHPVIAPDLPGHGLSDPPAGDYSPGAHACAMRDLLSAIRTFLAATQPFRYIENRWVQLLSSAEPVEARHAVAPSAPGHVVPPTVR